MSATPSPGPTPLPAKVTLDDLRSARTTGRPMAMLTCYDYTTARHMRAAGVPSLLVGDSAGSVILGHPSTLPTPLRFLIELTAAVRRGHPDCLLVADMPFGSYHASTAQGVRNICRMAQATACDAVKLEVARSHLPVIRRATDAGVAIIAHLGLRPQAAAVLGGYRTQGRTPQQAADLLSLADACHNAGAVALLLEAVPSEVTAQIAAAVPLPIIGCGAGPHAHGHVVVTHDLLGLTPTPHPRFVPDLPPDLQTATRLQSAFAHWTHAVATRTYPEPHHEYTTAATSKPNTPTPSQMQSPALSP